MAFAFDPCQLDRRQDAKKGGPEQGVRASQRKAQGFETFRGAFIFSNLFFGKNTPVDKYCWKGLKPPTSFSFARKDPEG